MAVYQSLSKHGFAFAPLAAALLALPAFAEPHYTITTVGLTDAVHTSDDGYRESRILMVNVAQQYLGYSQRFDGDNGYRRSAWIYDHPATTYTHIGLVDAEHTSVDGYSHNDGFGINSNGYAVGEAARYNGTLFTGSSAWLYDGSTTRNISLTGSEYTRNDGYLYSKAIMLNDANQVLGGSSRFIGAEIGGSSAWIYDGNTSVHTDISLADAEHTFVNGYRESYGVEINQAGQVIGGSVRFDGGGGAGNSAWLYSNGSHVRLGLIDAEHTHSSGYQASWAHSMNEAGQVIGSTRRFNSTDYEDTSAWLYDGTTTVRLGLTDAAHTYIDGSQSSEATAINQSGDVVGYSAHFASNGMFGGTTWYFDGSTTQVIGLSDDDHAMSDGFSSSMPLGINDNGLVLGHGERHLDDSFDTNEGQDAWLYDGSETRVIGLTDAAHTDVDGVRDNYAEFLSGSNQVAGRTSRFDSDGFKGYDTWFYDYASDQTFSFTLSESADGFAQSIITSLSDDGVVLGIYEQYDEADNVENRIFYFSMADGVWDLGALVVNLDVESWSVLYDAIKLTGIDNIFGAGRLADGSSLAFILEPTEVPLPAGVWLFGSALVGTVAMRRKK